MNTRNNELKIVVFPRPKGYRHLRLANREALLNERDTALDAAVAWVRSQV